MANLLIFKSMICQETAKNKKQLHKALKKIETYAVIALNTGRIINIDLKEMEEPKFTKDSNRKALGLDPVERFNDT